MKIILTGSIADIAQALHDDDEPELQPSPMPVFPDKCRTCPFARKGYKHLQPLLTLRSMRCTPICHSTGPGAITKPKHTRSEIPHACRGARDIQLGWFVEIGFLPEATDKAWFDKCREMGML